MKKFYIVVQTEENDKYYAYAIIVNTMDNLLNKLDNDNFVVANICETRRKAEELVHEWNESFKNNGEYLFE